MVVKRYSSRQTLKPKPGRSSCPSCCGVHGRRCRYHAHGNAGNGFKVIPPYTDSIGTFTETDVVELLTQHTEKTGQRFLPEAIAEIYRLGQGHPWLTNASKGKGDGAREWSTAPNQIVVIPPAPRALGDSYLSHAREACR